MFDINLVGTLASGPRLSEQVDTPPSAKVSTQYLVMLESHSAMRPSVFKLLVLSARVYFVIDRCSLLAHIFRPASPKCQDK